MTTKGFEFQISKQSEHLFITNKVGEGVSFTCGFFEGKPMASEYLFNQQTLMITDEQFLQLVERLSIEADKIRKQKNKKEPKATLDFGEDKPKKKKGDPA